MNRRRFLIGVAAFVAGCRQVVETPVLPSPGRVPGYVTSEELDRIYRLLVTSTRTVYEARHREEYLRLAGSFKAQEGRIHREPDLSDIRDPQNRLSFKIARK